ncbi:MAG TPA: hypothetical protein VFZ69_02815 [Longimicrobiales bacterium]
MTQRTGLLALALCVGILTTSASAAAQEARLVGRLPDADRARIDDILIAARAAGLPTEPLVDRALEGAAKGAPANLIVTAVVRLRGELDQARIAFGDTASPAELTAGASALRAGATSADLARLRQLRPGLPLTVPAGVLADLAAAGVPMETGLSAVLALADEAADADYVAFRRNVERDIALGASPVAAVGVRLRAVADDLASSGDNRSAPRKRKP